MKNFKTGLTGSNRLQTKHFLRNGFVATMITLIVPWSIALGSTVLKKTGYDASVAYRENSGLISLTTIPPGSVFQIKGRIVGEDAAPIPGVSIIEKGTNNGTTTNTDGRFTLNVKDQDAVLVISNIGYVTQELNARSTDFSIIVLNTTRKEMDEVVVVGYGTVRKGDLTGAVSSVSFDENEAAQITSVDKLLQGRAAGVMVNTGSAAPGGAINVRIRGASSISGGNEPLYVIDGVIVTTATQDATNSLKVGTNPGNSYQEAQNGLTGISPQDIESIEILKDASATAIYGSRGANGVVLITTKQGKAGRANITYSTTNDFARVSKKMPMLEGFEFAEFRNQVAQIEGRSPYYRLDTIKPINWQDDIFRTGITTNNRLNINGKNERSNYYVAFGYLNNDGIIPTTGFKQGDIRFNFSQDVSKKLKISLRSNILYRRNSMTQSTEQMGSAGNSIIRQMLSKEPFLDSAGPTLANLNEDIEGPRVWLKEYDDIAKEFRTLQSLTLEYKLSNAFSLRTMGAADIRTKDRARWFGKHLSQGKAANGQLGLSALKAMHITLKRCCFLERLTGITVSTVLRA